jgi:hypothetical protein
MFSKKKVPTKPLKVLTGEELEDVTGAKEVKGIGALFNNGSISVTIIATATSYAVFTVPLK